MSKNFLSKPSKSKTHIFLHLSHSQICQLIELITGHSNLNYMQSKIDPINIFPLSRFCEDDETFAHLFNKCPCFLTYRCDILQNKLIINTLSWTLDQLLSFSYIPSTDAALNLKEIHE